MGQKVHPTAYRLALTHNWASKWYAPKNKYRDFLAEDIRLRDYLKKNLPMLLYPKLWLNAPKGQLKLPSQQPSLVL